jgi:hypothetical protein
VLLALVTACAGTRTGVDGLPTTPPPILPAPRAQLYAPAPGAPRDPPVARAVREGGARSWDEALSGAAGALALRLARGDFTEDADARWAARTAGWPGTIQTWAHGRGDDMPEALAERLRGVRTPFGLARARSGSGDVWVLLLSEAGAEPPSGVAREGARGDSWTLPEGFRWRAVSPEGAGVTLAAGTWRPEAEGMWLLEAASESGERFPLPVFVDVPPPEQAPPTRIVGVSSDDALLVALGALASWDGHAPPRREPQLDIVARLRAQSRAEPLETVLARLGWAGEPASEVACTAASLQACLESGWWSADGHGALRGVHPEVGWTLQPTERGVTLHLVAAG